MKNWIVKVGIVFFLFMLFVYIVYCENQNIKLKQRIIMLEASHLSSEVNLCNTFNKVKDIENKVKILDDTFYSFSSNLTIHAMILNNIQSYLGFRKGK